MCFRAGLACCLLLSAAVVAARAAPRCVVLDVGAVAVTPECWRAAEAAVARASSLQPHPDAALRRALRGEPREARGGARRAAPPAAASQPASAPASTRASTPTSAAAVATDPYATLRRAARALRRAGKAQRLEAVTRIGREAGADRVLAIELRGGRVRAQLFDVTSGQRRGGLYEADAASVVERPAGLAAFLDSAPVAGVARGPAGRRPAPRVRLGSKWWHWAVGVAVAVTLGYAVYQSEQSADQVTIRVVKP